jgi:AraC-like DNA-binding protein
MDPLSDVLSMLKLASYTYGGWDMGGPWAIAFRAPAGVKCYAIVSGSAWLDVDGVAEPVRLVAGDCFLLPRGRAFRLASALGLPAIDVASVLKAPLNGAIAVWHGGGDCLGVGGHFTLAGKHADLLLNMLPPIVHLRAQADKDALRWAMERMMQELRAPQPGGALIAQQLAQMMLVQALRQHLAEGAKGGVGWLFALADPQMAVAIGALHAEPERRWTLQALAERTGMSRSALALKFKQTVGATPIDYLTRWRMLVAGDRLAGGAEPVSAIALSLGYESESAFSTAFKRVMGCSPRQYGRREQVS